MIYHGPLVDAPAYFESIGFPLPPNCNPADFYLDVAAGVVPHKTDPNFEWPMLFDYWEERRLAASGGALGNARRMSTMSYSEAETSKKQLDTMESHSVANVFDTAVIAVKQLYYEAEDYALTFYKDSKETIMNFGKPDPIRETPNTLKQFELCLLRAFKQVFRRFSFFIMEMMLHLGAGFVISVAANRLDYVGPYPGRCFDDLL